MPEEQPAAPRTQAGLADERFAANVRHRRERAEMSQAQLAEAMAEGGFHWYPQTVHRVETGTRKVSVGEAKAVAEILSTTVDRLTQPGQEASAAAILMTSIARARQAWRDISGAAYTLRHQQYQLELTVPGVERDGYFGSAEIRRLADEAREVMELSGPEAVADGFREHDEVTASLRAAAEESATEAR